MIGARGRRLPAARAYGVAAAFLVAATLVSALVGAADLNPLATITALLDRIPFVHLPSSLSPLDRAVLFDIRLPRIVLGLMVGALLSVAGAGYQGVFRNPLVDSGLLGASAGAGLGATLAIVYLGGVGPSAVPVAAFVGSLAGVTIAYLSGAVGGSGTATLLLAGRGRGPVPDRGADLRPAALGPGPAAGLLLAARLAVRRDLAAGRGDRPLRAVSVTVVLLHGRHLDVLSVGDEEARALGLHPGRIRLVVVAACALAAASAVAVSGLIGFVGIVVPHVVRRLAGPSYRLVLPLSLLFGAGFLVLADTAGPHRGVSRPSCPSAWSPRWSARRCSSGSCAPPPAIRT